MPHPSLLATDQTGPRSPQPDAFRSFVEGVREFRRYQETDRGENLKAAAKAFCLAAEADPVFHLARFNHAVALAHLREHDKAIEILEDLARWDVPFKAEVLYNLAYACFKKYDLSSLQRAEAVLGQAEELAQANKNEFLLLLAQAMRILLFAVLGGREAKHPEDFESRKKKYLPEAVAIGEQLLANPRVAALGSPQDSDVVIEAHNGLGVAYMRLGENADLLGRDREDMWQKAERCFRAALEIQPTNTRVLQNLGTLRRLQGDFLRRNGETGASRVRYAESRDSYLKSLSINSLDQFPHFSASICSAWLEEWEVAKRYYESGLSQKGAVRKALWEELSIAIEYKDTKFLPAE